MRPGERIHVIGIAGSGAAGVALLMHHAGLLVDGCDADTPSPYTPPLEAAGITILSGHDPAHPAMAGAMVAALDGYAQYGRFADGLLR